MNRNVYITSVGKFLPGDPIANDEIEDYLGQIGGKPSRTKRRILNSNGILTRHYAIDKQQNPLYSNTEMAAHAIRDSIERARLDLQDIDYLAVATAQGDLALPGFASMVHGELGMPPLEVATLHGICVSGMMAMKSAYLQVKAGEKRTAVSCASEFPSRVFKNTRYETQKSFEEGNNIPFDTDFLRWMLSDGAGATVLQDRPNPHGLSLKVEWIELKSYADRYDVCMYSGVNKNKAGEIGPSWLDYPTFESAAADGAINIKQDIGLVKNMPKLGVDAFFELIDNGKVNPSEIDWMVCHYSSHFFRDEIFALLQKGGLHIPEEKWFTNLYTKGNTGSASIYIMLEELFNEGDLRPGQKVLCMVPESGRFITSFMYLTVVGPEQGEAGGAGNAAGVEATFGDVESVAAGTPHTAQAHTASRPNNPSIAATPVREPEAPQLNVCGTETQEWLVRQLVRVWIDFETKLNDVPILRKLNQGRFTLDDYQLLLLNIRQQVIHGAQWIARAASNLSIDFIDLRSTFLEHADDEHRDYRMLEQNYVSVGGELDDILTYDKNIGSEALNAWMFHRASRENPFDLLGAMFIIEGLGNRMANHWGAQIRDQLGLREEQVSFLLYHGENDVNHFERFEQAISSDRLTMDIAASIVKTAKVTARLYLLQLEELGNV